MYAARSRHKTVLLTNSIPAPTERLVESDRLLQGVRVVDGSEERGAELTSERMMIASHMGRRWRRRCWIPGITLDTTPTRLPAIKQMRLKRFEGARWDPARRSHHE